MSYSYPCQWSVSNPPPRDLIRRLPFCFGLDVRQIGRLGRARLTGSTPIPGVAVIIVYSGTTRVRETGAKEPVERRPFRCFEFVVLPTPLMLLFTFFVRRTESIRSATARTPQYADQLLVFSVSELAASLGFSISSITPTAKYGRLFYSLSTPFGSKECSNRPFTPPD